MAEPPPETLPKTPPGPILSAGEARKRLALYMLVKFAGLASLFGGAVLSQHGINPVGIGLLGIGLAALFVRPRTLGLTTRPEKPPAS